MRNILNKCKSGKEMSYSEWCSISSYKGWVMYCNGFNLTKKYINPLTPYVNEYYRKNIKKG